MLPGKQYNAEALFRSLRRRKWLILVPVVVIAAGTTAVSRFLPNVYTSEAVILVVPQRVPESYVRSTVVTPIEDRIQSISQEIMSRARLERIISELNLYANERKEKAMEDVVAQMRMDITVNIPRTRTRRDAGSSFRVGYSSREPRKAMQVTERLASLFVQENLRDREVMAEGTDEFLESQLEEARQRLQEDEARLQQYRQNYAGELPSQLQSNLQVLQATQTRLQTLGESNNRDRDRLLALDRLIADAEVAIPAAPQTQRRSVAESESRERAGAETNDGAVLAIPRGTTAEQLETARNELRELELRLKPEHPDIQRGKRIVAELEKKAEAEALQTPLSPATTEPALTADERNRRGRLSELRAEKVQLTARVAATDAEQARLQKEIATYRARIEAAPKRESELVALNRDYETLQERYRSLLSKREDAKIAANLERRQIGEQFKLIEPARLPQKPVSPNRALINFFGALAGLGLGLGLAAVGEFRDSKIRTSEDVVASLSLPVLATIPVMRTTRERRKTRRRLFVSFAAMASLVAGVAVLIWKLRPWGLPF